MIDVDNSHPDCGATPMSFGMDMGRGGNVARQLWCCMGQQLSVLGFVSFKKTKQTNMYRMSRDVVLFVNMCELYVDSAHP